MWCVEVFLKEFFLIYSPLFLVASYISWSGSVSHWNLRIVWPVRNWETRSVGSLCLLYDVQVCGVGENVLLETK